MVASELARQPIVTNGMSSSIRFNHPKSASTRNRNAGRVANPNSKLPSRNSSKSTQLNSIKPNESFACAISTAATTKTTCKNYHKLINEPSSSSRSSSNRARQVSLLPIRTDTRRGVRQARANEAPLGLSRQLHKSSAPLLRNTSGHLAWLGSKMSRLIRWPLVHLCLPLCLTTLILITALALVISVTPIVECRGAGQYQTVVAHDPVALASLQTTTTTKHEQHPTRTNQSSAYLLPPTLTQLPGSSGGPLASAELNEQRATKEEAQTTGRTTLTTATSGATSLDSKLASKDHHRQEPARQNINNNNNNKNHDDEHEREIKAQNFQLAAAPHLPPMDTTIVAIARGRRSLPWATGTSVQQQQKLQHQTASSLLMPINELRVSGSKLEPPSRPSQDWSKQRPYFGPNLQRNLSVELGKTAHLVCKVFELGDKTVSWLRHGNDQVLTAGKYTFASDPRISAMNENGSTDWVLEIKDVGLNDSTSYECQVSTDPKLSQIFNLHVQAARARIKNGENNYYPVGANIEFACEILPPTSIGHQQQQQHLSRAYNSIVNNGNGGGSNSFVSDQQQIYWYHNGNLMNYAKTLADFGGTGQPARQNFSIEWDQTGQVSRLKLANIQLADSGNYTCKPTSAEPATVRLFVKKQRNSTSNRVHYSGGHHHVPNSKEAQRTRQHHEADFMESSSGSASNLLLAGTIVNFLVPLASVCLIRTILNCCRTSTNRITI